MRLSFPYVFRTLMACSNVNSQEELYDLITTDMGVAYYDSGTFGKYLRAERVGRSFINAFANADRVTTVKNYNETLLRRLKPNHAQTLTQIIINIIKEDSNISDNDRIGFNDYKTKDELVNLGDIPLNFGLFLFNVFYYTLNVDESTFIAELDYIHTSIENQLKLSLTAERINIEFTSIESEDEEDDRLVVPIKTQVEANTFNNTFIEIPIDKSDILVSASIKLFSLNVVNNVFDLNQLSNFVFRYLKSYVFSQLETKSYMEASKIQETLFRAIEKIFRSRARLHDHFAEIMIYSFLEAVENAPKIMSSLELREDTTGSFHSSGIHLKPDLINEIDHKIIFGSSSLDNDLQSALSNSFSQVLLIKNNEHNEMRFINAATLDARFNEETSRYLKEILLPNSRVIPRTPSRSFGVFISYSTGIDSSGKSPSEYREALQNKMQEDILSTYAEIQRFIIKNRLNGYDFNFYFLPLDQAVNNASEIMERLTLTPEGAE